MDTQDLKVIRREGIRRRAIPLRVSKGTVINVANGATAATSAQMSSGLGRPSVLQMSRVFKQVEPGLLLMFRRPKLQGLSGHYHLVISLGS